MARLSDRRPDKGRQTLHRVVYGSLRDKDGTQVIDLPYQFE